MDPNYIRLFTPRANMTEFLGLSRGGYNASQFIQLFFVCDRSNSKLTNIYNNLTLIFFTSYHNSASGFEYSALPKSEENEPMYHRDCCTRSEISLRQPM